MHARNAYNTATVTNVVPLKNAAGDQAARERAQETALLEQVRDEQSRGAFEQLFARLTPRLNAWLLAQGCEASTAENVVQDVMVTAWTRATLFDASKASARTWLYTLVRNRLIDYQRAGGRRGKAMLELQLDGARDDFSEDNADTAHNRAFAHDLLMTLPPEQRDIIALVYLHGYSHREVAEQLELPIGTVKSRTRLAFNRLRKTLEEA